MVPLWPVAWVTKAKENGVVKALRAAVWSVMEENVVVLVVVVLVVEEVGTNMASSTATEVLVREEDTVAVKRVAVRVMVVVLVMEEVIVKAVVVETKVEGLNVVEEVVIVVENGEVIKEEVSMAQEVAIKKEGRAVDTGEENAEAAKNMEQLVDLIVEDMDSGEDVEVLAITKENTEVSTKKQLVDRMVGMPKVTMKVGTTKNIPQLVEVTRKQSMDMKEKISTK